MIPWVYLMENSDKFASENLDHTLAITIERLKEHGLKQIKPMETIYNHRDQFSDFIYVFEIPISKEKAYECKLIFRC